MLDLLRKKAQSPLIQGTILIIALVFIFWGVGGGYRNNRNSIAKVNDEIIPYEDFQKAYNQLADQYSEQFGGSLPKGLLENIDLEGQAVEQLIQRALLRQGARQMGIKVSDLEVQQAIEKMEAFRSNGIFNVAQYENILTSSGMTPTSFEEAMRTDLLAGRVLEQLSRFAKATPLEIKDQFNYDNKEIKLEYASFSIGDFKDKVPAEEERLKAYYEENSENYKTEPQVKLHFLAFPFASDKKTAISDEAVEAFYRENISRYTVPEQRRARHILFKTSADDSEEALIEKHNRAEQVLELAKTGEDFAALAKQYSEGPSGPKGGELGTFSRGRMVKPFEDAAFALEEGEISDIVETQFGFHIIKLEKIEPAHTKKLEEVKPEILAGMQEKKSSELAFNQATEAYENIILAGSMDKYSQESGMPYIETEFFARSSPDKSGTSISMLKDPAFLNAAFALNRGELSSLVETPKGYAIIFAADRKEPETAPFQDVRDKVREDYVRTEAGTMAEKAADAMLTKLRAGDGADFAAEAARFDIKPEVSDYITRSESSAATLPAQVIDAGFELSEDNPYPGKPVAAGGMFYVFRVMEKRSPPAELFSSRESEFKSRLLDKKKAALLSSWLANVRDRAEIEINRELL